MEDIDVYDDVSTMAKDEMMRLLLHSFYAIKVSFFYTKVKACNTS